MLKIYTFIHNVQVENELLIAKIKEKKAELEKEKDSFITEIYVPENNEGLEF